MLENTTPYSNTTYLIIDDKIPTEIVKQIKRPTNKTTWFVYGCSIVANLLLVIGGCMQVWLSPVIVLLRSNNTDVNPVGASIETLEVAILAAVLDLSLFFGFIVITFITNKFGRKQILLYSAVSILIALTVIAFSKHIYIYYVFLSIVGFSLSFVYVNVPVYNAEIADTHNRARIGCLVGLALPSGVFITYFVGFFYGFTILTLACALPAVLFLLTAFFIVESPVYFVIKHKTADAMKSLERLRKNKYPEELEIECEIIEKTVEVMKNRNIFDLFRSTSIRKALFLSTIIAIGQPMSGIIIILTFSASIFNEAGSDISGNAVGIVIGSLQFFVVLVTTYIVESVGRRRLLLFSILCCSVCMLGLSLCFFIKEVNPDILRGFSWLPVLILASYIISFNLGFGPIPMTLITELFPSDLRCAIVAIYFMTMTIVASFLNFVFPLVSEHLGSYSCMLFYGIFTFLTFITLYKSLPETKGKTLEEIQKLLDNRIFSTK